MRAVAVALLLSACAAPRVSVRPLDAAPALVVESPAADSVVHGAEAEVRGTARTRDGRGWVWVDGTQAAVENGRFVAHHVPMREGKIGLGVELTDGDGKKTRVVVPVVVETHDRPFSSSLCRADGCVRYETRGTPRRDASGRIANAIVVVSAYGFGEKLDDLWPELVGPGRALDSRKSYIVGVAADAHAPIEALFDDLASRTPIVGASMYGVEVVLRLVAAHPRVGGTLVLVGGHDRPLDEAVIHGVRAALDRPDAALHVAELMVNASYTPAYLAEPRHAAEHGLVEEAKAHGLASALVERQRARPISVDALRTRLDAPPAVLPDLAGRSVVIVENGQDRLSTLSNVQAFVDRLRALHANVRISLFSDELGHSAYFRRAVPELEQALAELAK